ncbi:MAG: hypothetical protein MMC33_002066 [Icmadophila ericetorum]|nr:hypothetical protein [Icmadophila ericetorum]
MGPKLMATVLTGLTLCTFVIASSQITDADIVCDVCIIGGGSAGTYTAINLQKQGLSVVVVEKQDRLGGHTETYTDPFTGAHDDIGVVVWHNITVATEYFAHFNISLAPVLTTLNFSYLDFSTGKPVPGFVPPNPSAALKAYTEQLEKYPYIREGYYLPDPVPSDLLLPFGDFVQKYNLGGIVLQIAWLICEGAGDILQHPTLYIAKLFGLDTIKSMETAFVTTARGDNSLLYEAALAELGSNVLLNSTVISTDRISDPDYASITVSTPSGQQLIKAKTIVLAIPPELDNLAGWDLSDQEIGLFVEFTNSAYYTCLINNTGISPNQDFTNIGNNRLYNLPRLPATYTITQSTIPGLFDVKYASTTNLSTAQVQANILADLENLKDAGEINGTSLAPNFVIFKSHTPFLLTVPTHAIQGGFYKLLYALQGQRKTFYTGAAWQTEDSSLIWRFTRNLLPSIVKATVDATLEE